MGYDLPDVYTQPEHFGLRMVGQIDWQDEPFEYDMTIVLTDEEGKLYWGNDSGCSCPCPFEHFTSTDYLHQGSFYELSEHLMERLQEEAPASTQVTDLLARIQLTEANRNAYL